MTTQRLLLTAVLLLAVLGIAPQADADLAKATQLLQAQDFAGAEKAFKAVTKAEPDNAQAWLGLGQSYLFQNDCKKAIPAFRKANEAGGQAGNRALFHGARCYARMGDSKSAIQWLEKMAATGTAPYQAVKNHPDFRGLQEKEGYQNVLTSLKPCASEAYRAFDFWLGEWNVHVPNGQLAGVNSITQIQEGCAIREDYNAGNITGNSLNFYDKASETWNQIWVDNQGNVLRMSGGLVDGKMVLTSDLETVPASRITWSKEPGGKVRQLWEQSTDGGKTWGVAFNGLYSKK